MCLYLLTVLVFCACFSSASGLNLKNCISGYLQLVEDTANTVICEGVPDSDSVTWTVLDTSQAVAYEGLCTVLNGSESFCDNNSPRNKINASININGSVSTLAIDPTKTTNLNGYTIICSLVLNESSTNCRIQYFSTLTTLTMFSSTTLTLHTETTWETTSAMTSTATPATTSTMTTELQPRTSTTTASHTTRVTSTFFTTSPTTSSTQTSITLPVTPATPPITPTTTASTTTPATPMFPTTATSPTTSSKLTSTTSEMSETTPTSIPFPMTSATPPTTTAPPKTPAASTLPTTTTTQTTATAIGGGVGAVLAVAVVVAAGFVIYKRRGCNLKFIAPKSRRKDTSHCTDLKTSSNIYSVPSSQSLHVYANMTSTAGEGSTPNTSDRELRVEMNQPGAHQYANLETASGSKHNILTSRDDLNIIQIDLERSNGSERNVLTDNLNTIHTKQRTSNEYVRRSADHPYSNLQIAAKLDTHDYVNLRTISDDASGGRSVGGRDSFGDSANRNIYEQMQIGHDADAHTYSSMTPVVKRSKQ